MPSSPTTNSNSNSSSSSFRQYNKPPSQSNNTPMNISKKTILRRMANTLGGDVPLSSVPRPVTSNPLLRRDWDNAAEVSEPPVWLKPSSSPHRKPSIFFSREPVTDSNAPKGAICVPASSLGRSVPLFKVTSQTCEYFALRLPLLKAGFKRIADAESAIDANIMWGKSWPVAQTARKKFGVTSNNNNNNSDNADGSNNGDGIFKRPIHRFQKVNHFSGSHKNLGCKSGMARNLQKLAEQYEERRLEQMPVEEDENEDASIEQQQQQQEENPVLDFIPKTYRLPEQATELKKALFNSDKEKPWIIKPSRGSCGRGVRVFKKGDAEVEQLLNQALGGKATPINNNNNNNSNDDDTATPNTNSNNNRSSIPFPTTRFPLHVVQEYLRRPLLIHGRKFDFRVYVCVTSYDPLVAYIHHSGLVRFAAKQYDKTEKDITDVYSHLTNYSVGRKLEAEEKEALKEAQKQKQQQQQQQAQDEQNNNNNNNNQDSAAPSSSSSSPQNNRTNPAALAQSMSENTASSFSLELKWSMEKFNDYLSKTFGGKEACDKVWTDIEDIIVKTLFAVQPQIYRSAVMIEGNHDASIELYGFDVMLDEDLKPWLIEVNTLPSLESSSAFDYNVKSNVVTDILNLAQLQLYDRSPEVFKQFGLEEDAIREPGNAPPPSSSASSSSSSSYYHTLENLFDPDAKLPRGNAAAATSFVGKQLPVKEDTIDNVCRVRDEISLMGGFRLMFPTPGKVERLGDMCVPALANSPRSMALWKDVKKDPDYYFNANKLNFPKLEGAVATLQPDNEDDSDDQ